jgi:aspartyl-tRNA(Asn)/glutamyl-tRNA(Gln) amidotransferase subunit A
MIFDIKKHFPIFQNHPDLVYLDSASTTQTPQVVLDAMNSYYTNYRANIHRGVYKLSAEATEMYESARKVVAKFINAQFEEIIFTSGSTQGLNMLAGTLGSRLKSGDNVVLTRMEHHANLIPWQEASKRYGFEIRFIELTPGYELLAMNLPIDEHTKIVSFVHVSNTLGTVNPIENIIAQAKKVGAITIIDAAQSVAHMPIDVKKIDCDFLVFSGHKMYGPTGVGVVYGKRERLETLEPYMFGGDMIKEVTFEKATWHDIPWKFEAGTPNIAGAKILENYVSPYSSTVYQRLINAGAILVGKANMDAWGHGASNENSDFGPVKNPFDQTRVAGGSGGGPAAAVSAGMAVFGIGEDTGGSIRNPAVWCNLSAMKVTYGRVSRWGCIAYASSFDTVGPTAKSAADCAVVLSVIAGVDKFDATSSPEPVDLYVENMTNSVSGKTIGIPKELFGDGLNPEIKKAIEVALKEFTALGVTIKTISMPLLTSGISLYYIIAPSETSSNLGRYDGVRYGGGREDFGAEAKRRIMMGTYALSSGYYDAYYKNALKVRTLLISEYHKALKTCDAILMPVTPHHPTKIGEFNDDPIQNMLTDIYTVTQNPAGVPSLALQCGFSESGLPIGLQLTGRKFSESLLFNLGYQYQLKTTWHLKKPVLDNQNQG